jgi:tRNA U54 and U55 pseudouridine synthase Pus10
MKIATGVRRKEQSTGKPLGLTMDMPTFEVDMDLRRQIKEKASQIATAQGIPIFEPERKAQPVKRDHRPTTAEKNDAVRNASGPAAKGQASKQTIKPPTKLIASGHRRSQGRGRPRIYSTEQEGWGVYDLLLNRMFEEIHKRKTDAIHSLETSQQKSWNMIKNERRYKPVRIRIIILDDEVRELEKGSVASAS